jgi:hypothetical protein
MKVVAFVHTDYHLILMVKEILKYLENIYCLYNMHKPNQRRLQLDFDFNTRF